MLTREQQQFWDENGYLVLPAFFSHAEVDRVNKLHKRLWKESPNNVVVDDIDTNRRCYMSALSKKEKKHRCKVNDLYLNYEEVRSLSLNEQLVEILDGLLPDAPVLCNSLSLDYGTQQFLHVDSLYMTPLSDCHLTATWIALEDCHPDAGPLCYVPGSHKIPIYRFSTGSAHVVNEEFSSWQEYVQNKIKEWGLKEEIFLPKKGDVFIWHSQLLHGGTAINNPKLTRKSIVSHYFTKSDCAVLGSKLVPAGMGYWMDKPPLQIPDDNGSNIQQPVKKMSRVEHVLRTTLHYYRLWKRDVLNFPQ